MMTTDEIIDKYGQPIDDTYLVDTILPFQMYFSWDPSYWIGKFKVHKKIKDNVEAAFHCIYEHYGLEEIIRLKINEWGGCHNDRKMRGSNKWSRHAWGIAIDLFPTKNGLRTKAPDAAFSHKEYRPLIDIMYEHNFINYGVEKGYDWMHFEIKN